jgi:glucose-1-phosphate adenylyltransferase
MKGSIRRLAASRADRVVRRRSSFPSVRVEEGAVVEHSLLFESVTVGAEALLQRCIVEKDVVIPPGERIGFDPVRVQLQISV